MPLVCDGRLCCESWYVYIWPRYATFCLWITHSHREQMCLFLQAKLLHISVLWESPALLKRKQLCEIFMCSYHFLYLTQQSFQDKYIKVMTITPWLSLSSLSHRFPSCHRNRYSPDLFDRCERQRSCPRSSRGSGLREVTTWLSGQHHSHGFRFRTQRWPICLWAALLPFFCTP